MKYLWFAKNTFFVVAFWAVAGSVQAQWSLDAGSSSVEFVSIKNNAVAESHHFDSFSGSVGKDGSVNLVIDLDSVKTLIEIRNERIRKMLFETASFPQLNVEAKVDAALLERILGDEGAVAVDIPVTVSLHGREKVIGASVVLARTSDGGFLAVTSKPILIKAADFELEKGIELLRAAAGLSSISSAVPVSFSLEFVPKS